MTLPVLAALAALLIGAAVYGAESGEGEEADPAADKKSVIRHFVEFRTWDDRIDLDLEKVRGTASPGDTEDARGIRFRARHPVTSLALRIEAGPLLGGAFRVGLLRATLHDHFRAPSDAFPAETGKIHESLATDPGAEFGLSVEVRAPVHDPLVLGLFYEIGYGVATIENESMFLTVVKGEYRYFTHTLLLFGQVPIPFRKPFRGTLRPRLGLGAFIYRGDADWTSPDGIRDWDLEWRARQGFLVRLDLVVETRGGVYGAVHAEAVARLGFGVGAGVRF